MEGLVVNLRQEASSTQERKIQTSNTDESEQSTVAQSVVCDMLITPFCLAFCQH